MQRTDFARSYSHLALDGKIVIVSGPRQSGKTTAAKTLLGTGGEGLYFNWDSHLDRSRFAQDPLFFRGMERKSSGRPLLILDEIHKYQGWKSYLKGIYDDFAHDYRFLVTGSGRVDAGKRGGEALTGRFVSLPFFPLTLGELCAPDTSLAGRLAEPFGIPSHPPESQTREWYEGLRHFSGFPEPFLKSDGAFWRRWSDGFASQIVREDMQSMHGLRRLDRLDLLLGLLPSRVGSPLSQQNLAQNLGVAFETVRAWLGLFEAFFLCFHLETWTKRIARSILKEKKYYLFNVPEVLDPGARFENIVALELYRSVSVANARGEGRFGLYYLKNKDQQEVDFLLTENQAPRLLIEAKRSEDAPAPSLLAFQRQLEIPAVQLVETRGTWRRVPNGKHEVLVAAAHRWLAAMP